MQTPRAPFPPASTHRLAPRVITALAILALAAPAALATTPGNPIWTFQGIEDIECAAQIPDVNGDGIPDVVVETDDAGAVGEHLWCLSGGAPGPASSTIWSIHPPGGVSSGGGDGDECVRIAPDLDGDGFADVLLGTAWGGRTAYAINGVSGGVIWAFDTYANRPPDPPLSGWVYTITSIPDADGDTWPDVFFGCGSDNNRIYHANGASGGVLWSMDLGDAIYSTAALGDVSGDGIADCAVGVGDNADAVWVMRGGTSGSPAVWHRPMPGSVLALVRFPDLDLDGKDDVIAGAWSTDSTVFAFSGDDGTRLWTADLPGAPYVMRLAVLDDVTGDGVPEIAVGTWEDSAFILDGADGTTWWSFPTGGDVWAVERVDDLTGDGKAELAVGSFDHFAYLVDVAAQSMLWRYDTGNRLLFVMGTGDLDGNGAVDVFAGTQKLTGSPGGQAFLLEGGQGATAAGIPLVMARSVASGVEVTLREAWEADRAVLERTDGTPDSEAAAVSRFERDVADAWREGQLTTAEAVTARSQDPQAVFHAVSSELPLARGGAAFVDGSAERGHTYTYRFSLWREGVLVRYTPTATIAHGDARGDDGIPALVAVPNPARGGPVSISLGLARPQTVKLAIFDASGRRVAELGAVEGAGDIRTEWDGTGTAGRALPNGVYFVRAEGADFRTATKLTLLR